MFKRDVESIFKKYLLVEGLREIEAMVETLKASETNIETFNTIKKIFTMRCKDVVELNSTSTNPPMPYGMLPPAWNTGDKDKPFFSDDHVRLCIKWLKEHINIHDILKNYIFYKKYNLQGTAPLEQFAHFNDFLNFIHSETANRNTLDTTKEASLETEFRDGDVLFENDDVLIASGLGKDTCVRMRAVFSHITHRRYGFCIGEPTIKNNYYDGYRFSTGHSPDCFYYIYFKKIPTTNVDHLVAFSRRSDGSVNWTPAHNPPALHGWSNFVQLYKKYNIDFSKPFVSYDGTKIIPDQFLEYLPYTESEKADKAFAEIVKNKLHVTRNGFYDVNVIKDCLRIFRTDVGLKALATALIGHNGNVPNINAEIWGALPTFCKEVIINTLPTPIISQEVIESTEFTSNPKIANRYIQMIVRSTKTLPDYLLELLTPE